MACKPEFVQYVIDQCGEAGEIRCRKMFGDYGIYLNGTLFGLLCDDQLFVKITEVGKTLAPALPLAAPYPGAKAYFLVEELEDRAFLTEFIRRTCAELPPPKPRKKGGHS